MKRVGNQESSILICKILRVLFIIINIALIIGVVGILSGMIALGVVGGNTKIGNGEIKVFGEKATYIADAENNTLTIANASDQIEIELDFITEKISDLNAVNIVDAINKLNVKNIIIVVEVLMLSGLVTVIILCYIFRNGIKILSMTIDEETLFIYNNAVRFKNISTLYVGLFVLSIISTVVLGIIIDNEFVFTLGNVGCLIYAGIFYIASWAVHKGGGKLTTTAVDETVEEPKKKVAKKTTSSTTKKTTKKK